MQIHACRFMSSDDNSHALLSTPVAMVKSGLGEGGLGTGSLLGYIDATTLAQREIARSQYTSSGFVVSEAGCGGSRSCSS